MNKPSRFHTGGALDPSDPYYVERSADVEAVNTVRLDKYLYMTAPRQMGKTSFLKRLASQMTAWGWRCCLADLATMKGLEKNVWFRHLGENLAEQLGFPEPPRLNDQLDFKTFLLEDCGLSEREKPTRVALFFDEIEGLMGYSFSDEFLMVLRDLYQHRDKYHGRLFVAFAGAVDTEVLVKDTTISPFNVAERIPIEDFTAEEVRSLTSNLADGGVPVDEGVHDHIFRWTSGHPHLTQRICELLSNKQVSKPVARITAEEVDSVVRERILDPRLMDTNVKHMLAATAELSGPAASLWERVLTGETVTSYNPGFSALYLTGAVVETPDERQLLIRNSIYEEALRYSTQRTAASPESDAKPASQEPVALVMKGGSVKGLAYVGALKELVKYYRFDWFIGTSAGAIAAVLLAAGYTPDKLEEILSDTNFHAFLDAKPYQWPINFVLHRGLFPADALTDWLDDLLARKLRSSARVLLEELPNRVTVYAARRDNDARTFDSRDDAEKQKSAAFAVRCSMSIPLVFIPQRDEGMRVLDGGMRNNYPVGTLLENNPGTKFIGLYLGSPIYEGRARRDRTGTLIGDLLSIWMESPDLKALRKYKTQTIIIDPRPITTLSFSLTDDEKRFLVQAGRAAALSYLAEHPLPDGSMSNVTREAAQAAQVEVERERQRLVKLRAKQWRKRIALGIVIASILLILTAVAWTYL